MADDKLITPGSPSGGGVDGSSFVPAERDVYHPPAPQVLDEEEEGGGLDLRRYVDALWRRKWLLVLAVIVGAAGAAVAWKTVQLQYSTYGNLWVQSENQGRQMGDVEPIRTSGLLPANAWVQLLRSPAVLDSVVIVQHLYVSAPARYKATFGSFELADRFAPGNYKLEIADDGKSYTLTTKEGTLVERGTPGDSVGRMLGFRWAPAPSLFPPGTQFEFGVDPPRTASNRLSGRLRTSMDRSGNFISVSLSGPDPDEVANTLNAVLDRHIAVAADLKRGKLDEIAAILQEQLGYAQDQLEGAERELEVFRVRTIALPSDNSTPIAPGLQETRRPVFGSFFQMKVDLEQLATDRERLQAVLDSLPEQDVQIESLQSIPEAAASIELKQILGELVQARAQLRALRDRYADEYPPIQDQITRIRTLETEAIPRVVRGILAEMQIQRRDLQLRVDSASVELEKIPPRTIEEARLQRQVSIQERLYSELRQRVETARLASASSIPDVQILVRAEKPNRPNGDNRLQMAGMILLGSLGAGIGLAILLDRVDPKVRYPTQVSQEIGLPILGSIPRIGDHRASREAENAAQVLESFRELRLTIGFAYGTAGPITLVVTSPSQGEGKSLISTNLAVAYAGVGRRTLLIDGDTRRGDAHRLLVCDRAPGLTDYLADQASGDVVQRTEYETLDFIGSGTRGVTTPELLASPRLSAFLGQLKRRYDVIIIDTPPLAAGGDAVLLSALTGHMALVIRSGSTDKPLAVAKMESLSRLPIRVLGAILNDVEPSASRHYRYYSSYLPGYEPTEEVAEGVPSPLVADVSGADQAS